MFGHGAILMSSMQYVEVYMVTLKGFRLFTFVWIKKANYVKIKDVT